MAFALPRHRIVLAACLLAAGAHPCTALAADNRRFDASLEAYRAGVYRGSGKDSLRLLAQMHGRAVPVLREALADTRSESSPGWRNAAQLALAEALIGSDEVEAGMHALDQADAGVAQARETGSQGLQLLTRAIGLNRLGRHAGVGRAGPGGRLLRARRQPALRPADDRRRLRQAGQRYLRPPGRRRRAQPHWPGLPAVTARCRPVRTLRRGGLPGGLPRLADFGAMRVSEPILDAVRGVPAVAGIPGLDALSVSIGVAALQPPDEAWDSLVERADKALYRAKQEGRDRVVEAPAGD